MSLQESCASATGPVNNNSVKSNHNASRGSPDVGADDTCQRTRAAQEEGATPEMAAQVEALSQEVEQQRELIEQQRQQIELQLQELEETAKELEQQKQKWDEEKQAMKQEMEEKKTIVEAEREELQHQIEDKIHQVEEQKLVMEAQKQVMEDQKQVMEEQKQVIEEQQLRIADLAEESMVSHVVFCVCLQVKVLACATRVSVHKCSAWIAFGEMSVVIIRQNYCSCSQYEGIIPHGI